MKMILFVQVNRFAMSGLMTPCLLVLILLEICELQVEGCLSGFACYGLLSGVY